MIDDNIDKNDDSNVWLYCLSFVYGIFFVLFASSGYDNYVGFYFLLVV